MSPAEVYSPLKQAHVALVSASGLLFAVRGAAVVAGQAWPGRLVWRRLSVAVDSLLLCAGASLWWLLQLHPLHDTWLGIKLAALLGYIVLGSLALKRGRTPAVRALCFVAALVLFLWMVSVAHSHHPAGWFR